MKKMILAANLFACSSLSTVGLLTVGTAVGLASMTSSQAWANSIEINEHSAKAEAPGIVKIWATLLKDKGKKFDIGLHFKNESSDYIIILLDDMGCSRGNTEGVLKHTFFNVGERTIDFRPNQEKSFNLVCSETGTLGGTFQIKVNSVYDNPGHDHKTTGKIIASDLIWKYDAK